MGNLEGRGVDVLGPLQGKGQVLGARSGQGACLGFAPQGHVFRREAEQGIDSRVQGHGVGAGCEQSPVERGAVRGAVAVHAGDAVQQGDYGGQGGGYVQDHGFKAVFLLAEAGVGHGLAHARDAAKEVFYGGGDAHLPMSLEARQVQDAVGLHGAGREADAPAQGQVQGRGGIQSDHGHFQFV